MNFPVFNFPDVFAVCGTFGFVISYIAINIKKYLDEKREKKIKNE